eukprot:00101.XXX_570_761_1 [CDS] Oithona nana genome sequencing.
MSCPRYQEKAPMMNCRVSLGKTWKNLQCQCVCWPPHRYHIPVVLGMSYDWPSLECLGSSCIGH